MLKLRENSDLALYMYCSEGSVNVVRCVLQGVGETGS